MKNLDKVSTEELEFYLALFGAQKHTEQLNAAFNTTDKCEISNFLLLYVIIVLHETSLIL